MRTAAQEHWHTLKNGDWLTAAEHTAGAPAIGRRRCATQVVEGVNGMLRGVPRWSTDETATSVSGSGGLRGFRPAYRERCPTELVLI